MYANEGHHVFGPFIEVMKQKLLKYFTEIPFPFMCAAALNPNFNVVGVEVLLEQICRNFGLSSDHYLSQKRKLNKNFSDLFDIYKTFYGKRDSQKNSSSGASGSGSTSGSHLGDSTSLMASLFSRVQNESSKKSRFDSDLGELNMYMRTNFVAIQCTNVEDFENINLLEWWKQKKPQFPVLASMARDILTIQASTVASESAFSLSGRIISPRRTRLTPESVECCICLKDYLDSQERTQHLTSLEEEIDIVEANLEENEINQDLSTPPSTATDTDGSHGTASQYEEDDEPDIDDLEDNDAITRFRDFGIGGSNNPYYQ